ncbi:fibronectin type III domain-containing protein [Nocardiopsis alba]|uniref:fibronectin type III domain-containing protein n=1 Tax=Nocardiopsis alba TaxID=53437 RepID=UPI003692971E
MSTDSYRITGLEPGMTYNMGVSSANAFGPGIPTGTLNPVVVPGSAASAQENAEITWEAQDESFLGTAELWDGYPEGVAPTTDAFPQDPRELESEGAREERGHVPTGLTAREEDEE